MLNPPIKRVSGHRVNLADRIDLPHLRRARLLWIVGVNRIEQTRRNLFRAEENATVHNARDRSVIHKPEHQVSKIHAPIMPANFCRVK